MSRTSEKLLSTVLMIQNIRWYIFRQSNKGLISTGCAFCVRLYSLISYDKYWSGWDELDWNELLIKTINGLKDSRRPSTRVIVRGNTRVVWVRLLSSISRPLVTELCVCHGQIYWAPCDRLSLERLMILLSHIWPIKCPLCLWSGHEWTPVTVQPQRPETQTQVTYLQEEVCVCVCGVCGGCVCVFVFTHVYCT